jgi:hypothetical protein
MLRPRLTSLSPARMTYAPTTADFAVYFAGTLRGRGPLIPVAFMAAAPFLTQPRGNPRLGRPTPHSHDDGRKFLSRDPGVN